MMACIKKQSKDDSGGAKAHARSMEPKFFLSNGIALSVQSGDITKMAGSVVVVGEDDAFSGNGAVARALIRAGGRVYCTGRDALKRQIQKEGCQHKIYRCFAGSALPFFEVFHAITLYGGKSISQWDSHLENLFYSIGVKADELLYGKVNTPLLGAGKAGGTVDASLQAAVNGLSRIAPRYLKEVTIVEFDPTKASKIREKLMQILSQGVQRQQGELEKTERGTSGEALRNPEHPGRRPEWILKLAQEGVTESCGDFMSRGEWGRDSGQVGQGEEAGAGHLSSRHRAATRQQSGDSQALPVNVDGDGSGEFAANQPNQNTSQTYTSHHSIAKDTTTPSSTKDQFDREKEVRPIGRGRGLLVPTNTREDRSVDRPVGRDPRPAEIPSDLFDEINVMTDFLGEGAGTQRSDQSSNYRSRRSNTESGLKEKFGKSRERESQSPNGDEQRGQGRRSGSLDSWGGDKFDGAGDKGLPREENTRNGRSTKESGKRTDLEDLPEAGQNLILGTKINRQEGSGANSGGRNAFAGRFRIRRLISAKNNQDPGKAEPTDTQKSTANPSWSPGTGDDPGRRLLVIDREICSHHENASGDGRGLHDPKGESREIEGEEERRENDHSADVHVDDLESIHSLPIANEKFKPQRELKPTSLDNGFAMNEEVRFLESDLSENCPRPENAAYTEKHEGARNPEKNNPEDDVPRDSNAEGNHEEFPSQCRGQRKRIVAEQMKFDIPGEAEIKRLVSDNREQQKSTACWDKEPEVSVPLQEEGPPSTQDGVTDNDADVSVQGQSKSRRYCKSKPEVSGPQQEERPPMTPDGNRAHDADVCFRGQRKSKAQMPREVANTDQPVNTPSSAEGFDSTPSAISAAMETAQSQVHSSLAPLQTKMGTMPKGRMNTFVLQRIHTEGYEDCGVIVVDYFIPDGRQTPEHPQPGTPFIGCVERAFLPDNDEGRRVLELLEEAFDRRLTFQVCEQPGGQALVKWADIPHKTCLRGTRDRGGYPDPDYLAAVQNILREKYGIVPQEEIEEGSQRQKEEDPKTKKGASESPPVPEDETQEEKEDSRRTSAPERSSKPEGKMAWVVKENVHLDGFEPKCGTIVIEYSFANGVQQEGHPAPGQPYKGTFRRAFLPDNQEGRRVLDLLQKAFKRELTFQLQQIGPDQEWGVEFSNIPHKTSLRGGTDKNGYPDRGYLPMVKEILASLGIE